MTDRTEKTEEDVEPQIDADARRSDKAFLAFIRVHLALFAALISAAKTAFLFAARMHPQLTPVDVCLPHASGWIIESELNDQSHCFGSPRRSRRTHRGPLTADCADGRGSENTFLRICAHPRNPRLISFGFSPRSLRLGGESAFPRIPQDSPSRRIVSTKRKTRNEAKFGHNERAAKELLAFESHRGRGAAERLGARAWGIEGATKTKATTCEGGGGGGGGGAGGGG
jgi:hypothetical protein